MDSRPVGAAEEPSALKRVLRNSELLRVQLSWGVAKTMLWGWVVTMNAVVFLQGGAWAVGVFLAVRIVPGAIATPVVSVLSERWGLLRTLSRLGWVRSAAMVATTGLYLLDAPVATLIAVSAVEGLGSQPHDAEHVRALPWLARSAEELTAANSVTEVFRMGGILLGPTIAFVLLLVTEPGAPLVLFASLGVLSPLFLRGLEDSVAPIESQDGGSVSKSLVEGGRGVWADRELRVLVVWLAYISFCVGGLQVYTTGLSMDFLDLGASGPSLLSVLFGLGGLLGGMGTIVLVGRRGLALPAVAGAVLMGGDTCLMGLWPSRIPVFSAALLSGIGAVVLTVSCSTLLQRGVPPSLQATAYGFNAVLSEAAFGMAGIAASALVAVLGLRLAIVASGFSLVAVSLATLPSLLRFAARATVQPKEIELLRSSSVFNVLPMRPLERVAAALERLELPLGADAVRQGEPAEDFFIVSDGTLTVSVDGVEVNRLRPGDVFGEIGLLENVPRTATVTASEPSTVYRLGRNAFLSALDSNPETQRQIHAVSDARRAHHREQGGRR